MVQCIKVIPDQNLERKVGVMLEVVDEVGGVHLHPVDGECLWGHELHEMLAQMPDQPLDTQCQHHATFRGQSHNRNVAPLGRGCFMQLLHCISHPLYHSLGGHILEQTLELWITAYQVGHMLGIQSELLQ